MKKKIISYFLYLLMGLALPLIGDGGDYPMNLDDIYITEEVWTAWELAAAQNQGQQPGALPTQNSPSPEQQTRQVARPTEEWVHARQQRFNQMIEEAAQERQ